MALSEYAVHEIRADATTGNLNGGFFVSTATGTDFSQQTGAEASITNGATVGAGTTLLFTGASASLVGNGLQVLGGTNFVTGYFWITAASAGVSIDVDRTIATGVGANGTVNIGGAHQVMNATILGLAISAPTVTGTKFYVRTGNHTVSTSVTIASAGSSAGDRFHLVRGYVSAHDDTCTGTNRPNIVVSTGASAFITGAAYRWDNLIFNGTAASLFIPVSSNIMFNCKFTNTGTASGNSAVSLVGGNERFIACEFNSIRGDAVLINGTNTNLVLGCHFHNSNNGITTNGNDLTIVNSIFEHCITACINQTNAAGGAQRISVNNCTLIGGLGGTTPGGVGIRFTAGGVNNLFANSILYGLGTGISAVSASTSNADLFNNYFNNGTDAVNWVKNLGAMALDPGFINYNVISGTNAVSTAGALSASGADFSAVLDNQDYLFASGGGLVTGFYMITAHTTNTLTVTPSLVNNSSANKTFRIFTGRNYGIGTNLKALAVPGAFNIPTTSYLDVGAVQRQETASAGTGSTVGYARSRVVNRGSP